MHAIRELARRFIAADIGATMVEYSIMAALIAAVCVLAVSILGIGTNGLFTAVSNALAGA